MSRKLLGNCVYYQTSWTSQQCPENVFSNQKHRTRSKENFSKLEDFDSPLQPRDTSTNPSNTPSTCPYNFEFEGDFSYVVNKQNIIDEPETDISKILPINYREKVLKEILVKMNLYRLNTNRRLLTISKRRLSLANHFTMISYMRIVL